MLSFVVMHDLSSWLNHAKNCGKDSFHIISLLVLQIVSCIISKSYKENNCCFVHIFVKLSER